MNAMRNYPAVQRGRVRAFSATFAVNVLATLPVLDSVLNQANTYWHPDVFGFSLLQIYRGSLLPLLFILSWHSLSRRKLRIEGIVIGLVAIVSVFVIVALKEVLVRGALSMTSTIAYVQILYWVTAAMLAVIVCTSKDACIRVIKGVIIAGLVSATSIGVGYAIGDATQYYSYEGVYSSSGLFRTGKSISGMLIVAALCIGFIDVKRRGRRWLLICGALICVGASMLTFARAGMVAFALALGWLLIWVGRSTKRSATAKWVWGMTWLVIITGLVFVDRAGDEVSRRWSDVSQGERAGSGRVGIWKTAIDMFEMGDPIDMSVGVGYEGMYDLMQRGYGVRIHTHTDVLDMLLVSGVVGMLAYAVLWVMVIREVGGLRRRSKHYGIGGAIALVWFIQAMFTGQLFAPDAMCWYVIGFIATTRPDEGIQKQRERVLNRDRTLVRVPSI